MKKIRTILSVFLLLLTITLLYACVDDLPVVNLDLVLSQQVVEYQEGDSRKSVTKDITFKNNHTSNTEEDIEVTWSSDKSAIVVEGNKGKVTRQAADVDVVLTATAKYGESEKSKTVEVTVKKKPAVIDTNPPVISGAKNHELPYGTTEPNWLDGVTAMDEIDGAVDVTIKEKDVNMLKLGTYSITYSAWDFDNNEAVVTVSVVIIKATVAKPVLTISEGVVSWQSIADVSYKVSINGTVSTQSENSVDLKSINVDAYEVIVTAVPNDAINYNENQSTPLSISVKNDAKLTLVDNKYLLEVQSSKEILGFIIKLSCSQAILESDIVLADLIPDSWHYDINITNNEIIIAGTGLDSFIARLPREIISFDISSGLQLTSLIIDTATGEIVIK